MIHFVLINILSKQAIITTRLNTVIGTGASISAIIGARIVDVFAPMLQKPKAVPEKIAGKIIELAR